MTDVRTSPLTESFLKLACTVHSHEGHMALLLCIRRYVSLEHCVAVIVHISCKPGTSLVLRRSCKRNFQYRFEFLSFHADKIEFEITRLWKFLICACHCIPFHHWHRLYVFLSDYGELVGTSLVKKHLHRMNSLYFLFLLWIKSLFLLVTTVTTFECSMRNLLTCYKNFRI
jgi:hypothetical protein